MTCAGPQYQERHQDYVCGPDQANALANLTAAGPVITIPFRLDPDAPFLLRSLAVRVQYLSAEAPTQAGLQYLKMRFSGPNNDYLQQDLVRASLLAPYFGQAGNPHPYYPQVLYPASGVINLDVQNIGSSALVNVTVFFRGVKLYPVDSQGQYTYPDKFATLDFKCQRTYTALPVTTPTNGVRVIFRPPFDSDFVLRGIQAGPSFSRTSYEVFMRLLDENEKPFSNAPVHIDVLAGRSLMPAAYPTGTTVIAPTGTGASNPGLSFPEIYVPKTHILQYDLVRADAGFAGAVAEDFPITFIGSKVFPK
jgi:hypothetical protein